jgi:hypothetical protein
MVVRPGLAPPVVAVRFRERPVLVVPVDLEQAMVDLAEVERRRASLAAVLPVEVAHHRSATEAEALMVREMMHLVLDRAFDRASEDFDVARAAAVARIDVAVERLEVPHSSSPLVAGSVAAGAALAYESARREAVPDSLRKLPPEALLLV